MSTIQVKGVSKRFKDLQALDNISLEVKDKEFFCIVGPTNAGKTTTLRIIAGLEKPDVGEVYFDGELMNEVHPKDRDVAMMFQNLALYPDKNAFENIATPLKIQKVPQKEIEQRVQEVADILHIHHLLGRLPKTYSGGERQRVALGRTIVRRPRVYLFDEPLSNLDAVLRVEMRSELKRLQRDLGQTMIYVSHDQIEAMSMSDRLCLLDRGKIHQIDKPASIFTKPGNMFVAGFFGRPPMSFLRTKVETVQGKSFLLSSELKVDVSKLSEHLNGYENVILGVRPQDVLVRAKKKNDLPEFKVESIEPLGPYKALSFVVEKDILLGYVAANIPVGIGDLMEIEIDPSRIYLFDEKTQEVIL